MLKTLTAALFTLAIAVAIHFGPALAEETAMIRSVSVSGHGESTAVPDLATLNIGVSSVAATASDALTQNSSAMRGLMDLLKAAGLTDRDMTTSNFSVGPRYDFNQQPGQPPKVTGYEVNNMLTANVRQIDKLGVVLEKAVSSGTNQVNGVSFVVSNPQAALDEARKAAVADARRKAEIYAAAGGFKLGEIISLNEGGGWQPPVPMVKAMRAGAPEAVPIAQGEQTLAIDVSIIWAIK